MSKDNTFLAIWLVPPTHRISGDIPQFDHIWNPGCIKMLITNSV